MGLEICNSEHLLIEKNYDINPKVVDTVLSNRAANPTSLMGRILLIKQLVASKFVYRMSLLPSLSKKYHVILKRQYIDYIWESGRHKLAYERLLVPYHLGGFNMLDSIIQEKSLKLSWVTRLISTMSSMHFWKIHLIDSFRIPFTDLLRCNLTPSHAFVFLKTNCTVTLMWKDILSIWFNYFYIPPNTNDAGLRDRILLCPLIFNSACLPVTCMNLDEYYVLYEFLSENGVVTLKDYLPNVENIFTLLKGTNLFFLLLKVVQTIPDSWWRIVGNNVEGITACHIVDKCFAELMSAKAFGDLLKPHNHCDRAIKFWKGVFPDESIELKWPVLCKNAGSIGIPRMRSFNILMVNASFCLDASTAKYSSHVDELCTFCQASPETYLHFFWQCDFVQPLWIALPQFANEFFCAERFVPYCEGIRRLVPQIPDSLHYC